MTDTKTCDICVETLNKSTRKPICCILCEDPKPVCCSACFTKYLMGTSNITPRCVFCDNEVTMDFIYDNSTKIFMEQYRSHQFDMRFSIEESKLPETQDEANRIKWNQQKERFLKKLYNEKYIIHYQKKMLIDDLGYLKKENEEKISTSNQIEELRKKSNDIQKQYMSLHVERYKKPDKQQFVKGCPSNTCRGFLSTAYKCGTCEKYFCPDCYEVKQTRNDETHICDADTKATLDLLKSDSKACPKCSVLIFRISGCPQMWCVQCHTAFNWDTGHIDKGYVHNPEYFRYLRERGDHIPRNPNDIVNGCNVRIPIQSELRAALQNHKITHREWSGWYDYLNHVRWYVLPNEARNYRDIDYSEFRIAYLNDEITKEAWKKNLKMKMKKDELLMERFFILDMFCNVMSDLFINLMANQDIEMFQGNAKEIFIYTNSQMERLNKKFLSKDKKFFLDQTDWRVQFYFGFGIPIGHY